MRAVNQAPHLQALLADDASVTDLLACATPRAWLQAAAANLPVLLVDHANCEKKAASTAMALLHRYADHGELCYWMSRLAREELRHYEQVCRLMAERGIAWQPVPASRYAEGLRSRARREEPWRLLDVLLVGALIEARSCERFEALVPCLDAGLARFYAGLCAAERRHFQRYLRLACTEAAAAGVEEAALAERLAALVRVEAALVTAPDAGFGFHSGVPAAAAGTLPALT